jgi:hypothetical protein
MLANYCVKLKVPIHKIERSRRTVLDLNKIMEAAKAVVGDKVTVAKDVEATVIAVLVHARGVEYLCAWWHDGERRTDMFTGAELKTEDQSNKIGFDPGA